MLHLLICTPKRGLSPPYSEFYLSQAPYRLACDPELTYSPPDSKSGLVPYHHLLTEIAQSYLLLFGDTERSRKLFHNIDPEGRSPGYFDIFSLNGLDSVKPKWLYNSNEDFPVFGDRLIELKSLLKPKGLRGLWRDTRDSLQWYTFWAVVVVGGISLLLAFIQMVLGAVQAYASMKALHP